VGINLHNSTGTSAAKIMKRKEETQDGAYKLGFRIITCTKVGLNSLILVSVVSKDFSFNF